MQSSKLLYKRSLSQLQNLISLRCDMFDSQVVPDDVIGRLDLALWSVRDVIDFFEGGSFHGKKEDETAEG